MKDIKEKISVIPGVTGSCIFDKKEGSLCKDLNHNLSEDLLQTVGIHLDRLIQMGTLSGLNVKSVHFRFDKYTVVGMPLDTGAVLLTMPPIFTANRPPEIGQGIPERPFS